MRIDDTERESEMLREDLGQAQRRIATLLEMNQSGIHLHSDDEDEHVALRRGSSASSDGATSMAFDKVGLEIQPRLTASLQRSSSSGSGHGHQTPKATVMRCPVSTALQADEAHPGEALAP